MCFCFFFFCLSSFELNKTKPICCDHSMEHSYEMCKNISISYEIDFRELHCFAQFTTANCETYTKANDEIISTPSRIQFNSIANYLYRCICIIRAKTWAAIYLLVATALWKASSTSFTSLFSSNWLIFMCRIFVQAKPTRTFFDGLVKYDLMKSRNRIKWFDGGIWFLNESHITDYTSNFHMIVHGTCISHWFLWSDVIENA